MTVPEHVLRAVDEAFAQPAVIRPAGWQASNDVVRTWTRPGHLYRGMTEDEYLAHRAAGEVRSSGRYSLPGEGTNFSDDAADAESYVNFGRDDPRRTGRPNYVVEVRADPALFRRKPDGYWEATGGVPLDRLTRVWRMRARGDEVVAERV
jgi:hypothetical protein